MSTDMERLVETVTREVLAEREGRPGSAEVVAIGADHSAFALKQSLVAYLERELKRDVLDLGTHSLDSVDYPDIAAAVGDAVVDGRAWRGIVLDGAGIGSTMAANKLAGVRCALCHDDATVVNSRRHNDANVLALGSAIVNPGLARRLVRVWLETPFDGGRHLRRVEKIARLEERR
jgi:ribose 5-phosphate isomerase B